jgi:hypothetical protein
MHRAICITALGIVAGLLVLAAISTGEPLLYLGAALVVLPSRFDPAIRLKEWAVRNRR